MWVLHEWQAWGLDANLVFVHRAKRAHFLCGYKAVAMVSTFGILSMFVFFVSFTSCNPSHAPTQSWCIQYCCRGSIFVMMGLVVMSWFKISGCSQRHGIHDTLCWVCGVSLTQVRAHQNVGQGHYSLFFLWQIKTSPAEIEKAVHRYSTLYSLCKYISAHDVWRLL